MKIFTYTHYASEQFSKSDHTAIGHVTTLLQKMKSALIPLHTQIHVHSFSVVASSFTPMAAF